MTVHLRAERHEPLHDFGSDGFRAFWNAGLGTEYHALQKDLCENPHMTDAQFRGKQIALITLDNAIRRAFETAKIAIPEWLESELKPYVRR